MRPEPIDSPADDDVERLIDAAKAGSDEALSQLLARSRGYLLHSANQEMPTNLAAKLGASDAVQETMLEAHAGIARFVGTTESELMAWLRAILKHNLADMIRGYVKTEKRDVGRERRLASNFDLRQTAQETPSQLVGKSEQHDGLIRALKTLPADQRAAIELRNFELLSFAEIGRRLNRSEEAARKLWGRALSRLQKELRDSP